MKEKFLQDLIIRFPSEVLDEEEMTYIDREVKTANARLDIVLRDRRGRHVLVEVQIGGLDTRHIDRHIDFVEGYAADHPEVDVRVLFVANHVDVYKKTFLQKRGYEFKEIAELRINEIAAQRGFLQEYERAGAPLDDSQTTTKTKPDVEDATSEPIPNGSVYERITPATASEEDNRVTIWKAAGLSSGQINDLKKAIQSFEELVLPLKQKREADAEAILLRSSGNYTMEILNEVFDIVDKGPIGPVSGDWFGETLSQPNRNRLRDCPIRELNVLIDDLRQSGDLGKLGEWRRANKANRGMKTGMATLFMYLHSPERYNVWLPKTHSGLLWLCRLDAKFPKGKPSPEEYRTLYREFNEKAIDVREANGFEPQEMDWFLFTIDEFKTDSVDRGLRALIEGGRE